MKHQRRHRIAQEVVQWFYQRAGLSKAGRQAVPSSFTELGSMISQTFPIAVHPVSGLDIGKVESMLKRLDLSLSPSVNGNYSTLAGFLFAYHGGGIVFIEETDPEERRKFTLAHELGHFINDYYRPIYLKYESSGTISLFEEDEAKESRQVVSARCTKRDVFGGDERDQVPTQDENSGKSVYELHRDNRDKYSEIKANLFAAELLMPMEECRRIEFESEGVTQSELAVAVMQAFGVSRAAAEIRVEELRLGVTEERLL